MRNPLAALALLLATPAFAQTYNWIGGQGSPANDNWSTPANWSPLGPPVPGSSVIIDRLNLPLATGPIVDVDVSVASLIARNGGFFGGYESQNVHALNVTGSTTLGPNAGLISCSEGCTYTLGTFLNQSNATLLYGATLGAGNNTFDGPGPAIIQWRGANIVRNQAGIGLNPNAVLRDQDTQQDALRSFSQNAGVFGVGGHLYVTPGAFTNFGLIQVVINANQRPFSRMVINGNFVNFDAGSGVLNGGPIEVKGRYGGRAEFAFPGADIRTLAPGTTLRLEGDAAVLDSVTGANGLRNLGNLGGEFSVANALGVTPTNGVLQHTNGTLNVLTNGILTVTGDFQQYTAATVNVGRAGAGAARLVITGTAAVMGNFRFDGVGTGGANDSVVETQQLTTGTDNFISGAGTIRVNPIPEPQPLIFIDCRVLPGALPNVGPRPARAKSGEAVPARPRFGALPGGFPAPDEAPETIESTSVVPGRIRMEGAAAMSGSAKLLIGIAGLGAGVGHSVLTQVGAGGLQLDGQLSVTLAAGYTPDPVDTFEVVRSDALAAAVH